jgi:hypothetical protein
MFLWYREHMHPGAEFNFCDNPTGLEGKAPPDPWAFLPLHFLPGKISIASKALYIPPTKRISNYPCIYNIRGSKKTCNSSNGSNFFLKNGNDNIAKNYFPINTKLNCFILT